MRTESNYTEQQDAGQAATGSAYEYLKSLPPNYDSPVLDSYKRGKDSQIIDYEIAEDFTTAFRAPAKSFSIPISWNITKDALIKLLGITSYDGYDAVNGIRLYAGINGDNQLTLVAVSTQAGTDCSDDLTQEDNYPYFDYAKPCPNDCSNRGNLKVSSGLASMLTVQIVPSE